MTELDNVGLRSDLEDLDVRVEELTRRVASLEKTIAAMRALGEDFWRTEAAVLLMSAAVKSWKYDARDSNTLFADLFACETVKDGSAKRWVGKSGELGATIGINRAAPLTFGIQIVGFSAPELTETFKLEIDGEPVRWSARDGKLWSALIPERAGHAQLQFRVAVDRKLIPESKDVSFSIAELSIAPAQAAKAHAAEPAAASSVAAAEIE